jgi:BirA family biotin operon repressor/biotin-[acetyl-CoA-carboxylase] ligase
VVIAEHQTSGRGRQGRSWHSPAGQGLYFSLLLRPGLPAGRLSGLTLALGVSAAEAAERISGISMEVKWPNDLCCRGRKTGGILTELHTIGGLVHTVVVGLGLNVNNRDLPPELSCSAPSLSLESGKHLSREQLLAEMLGAWEQDYEIFLERGLTAFAQRLEGKLMLKGREVQVECGDQTFCGLLAGCDQEGALLLTDRQGGIVKCLSGTLREVIR